MKKLKKIILFLFIIIFSLKINTNSIFAATLSQDGLEIILTTDKEEYNQDEQIVATLTVTNTNIFTITNISLENIIPEGYMLVDNFEKTKQVKSLSAGETATLTVTYTISENEQTSNITPNTGDCSKITFWSVLLILAAIGIILILKKKKWKNFLSLFLCIIMISVNIMYTSIQINANEIDIKTIEIETIVKINKENIIIRAKVDYQSLLNENQTTYTVKFDSNGGSLVESQIIDEGNQVKKPDTPTRVGYIFVNWYSDSELKTPYDFSNVITKDIILYAKWEIQNQEVSKYPLNLDENDPDVEIYDLKTNIKSIVVGETEIVKFTSEIFANIVLEEKTVAIIDLNQNVIGYMNDDGIEGDEIASDGIYTLQTSLSNSQEAYITYYVAVKNLISDISVSIGFYIPLSDDEIREMEIVDTQISKLLSEISDYEKTEQHKQINALFEKLITDGLIVNDSVDYDSSYKFYSFQYSCGVQGGISLKDYENDLINSSIREENSEKQEMKDKEKNDFFSESIQNDSVGVDYNVINYENTRDVIILNGFEDSTFRRNYYNKLKNDWNNIGLNTIVDVDVTIQDMKNLADFDVIVFAMHGGLTHDTKTPALLINEMVTSTTDKLYSYELNTRKSVIRLSSNNTLKYGILPQFFTDSYNINDFDKTLIFSETCEFYGCDCYNTTPDYTMAQTFINLSAEAVIGYHNSVGAKYSRNIMKKTIEETFNGATIENALNTATTYYGKNDNLQNISEDKYIAYPIIDGNKNFILRSNGILTGNVLNASDSSPISRALIRIYDDGIFALTSTRTNTQGFFTIDGLSPGIYIMKITAGSYKSVRMEIEIKEGQITYLATSLLMKVKGLNNSYANGIISNSITAEGIDGVLIQMRNNWNNRNGKVLHTALTNENGYYEIKYNPGVYTLELSKDGFITNYINIFIGIIDLNSQNATLSPIAVEGTYRIVLTWGEYPDDLDSHVYGTYSNGNPFHVYYSHMYAYDTNDKTQICNLDIDDTTSYGPETITLNVINSKPYYYYVHHYSGSGAISTSNATVQVYRGSENIATFHAPTNQGTETYWNVFAIVNGELVIKNTITSSKDTAYVNME